MKNQVQLIAYVNRFGGQSLRELTEWLTGPLQGVFGGVHLLPFFYPIDGADAGFDPIDHAQVDPRLGDWTDVGRLSQHVDVMADLIVNHISVHSPQFEDFSKRGRASEFASMFLTPEAVFGNEVTAADLEAIYRPRPGSPFTEVTLKNGDRRTLWTTFTPQQIDINVADPQGRAYLERILTTLAANGVSMVRLDAAGYAVKKRGTNCFMLPETFEFISALTTRARALGIEVLVEIHSHFEKQIEIARQVDRVYDFALPPLLLHALAFKATQYLKHWIEIRPENCVTVLDTHDGIGIIDVGPDSRDPQSRPGLLPSQELDRLVEHIHAANRDESRLATGAAASNLDLYQVNCTYFDALGADPVTYLLARAVQFFLPGIPQVYYVGLLAGRNDLSLLKETRVGRDINRHYYSRGELLEGLSTPVVRALLELIRLRNQHPAFQGSFRQLASDSDCIALEWTNGADFAHLHASFSRRTYEVHFSTQQGGAAKLTSI